jgi:putative transcriptional regulator
MAGARSHEVSVDAIYGARFNARHTQREAGAVVYVAERTWQNWELDKRAMPRGLYELYLLKTGQMSLDAAIAGGAE